METNDKNSIFVYIRRQEGRVRQIIEELKRRGGNAWRYVEERREEGGIYYISDTGSIVHCVDGSAAYYWITKHYTEVELPYEPKDKELVWAWEDDWTTGRDVGFYDAKNHCCYTNAGTRNGGSLYDHFAPYEGEWPEWAKEAVKLLED